MKRLTVYIVLLITSFSFAQNEAAIWYFGQNAGLDFNSGTPVVLTDGQINTFEGCATISDYQGNLLFYTDGVTVWDRTHTIMPNGTGLLGNTSSTQSAIIVPKPNNLDQYFIFTVDDRNAASAFSTDGINYSTVDLTLNGGFGDILSTEKNISLVSPAYEKITAVAHSDNNSYWVITFIQDEFLAWRVDATGVNTTPVISNVGSAADSRGYLKVSPDGSRIACANFGTGASMRLFNFNNTTGVVSNQQNLTFNESNDIAYGVEFSTQSTKLYVTTNKINSSELLPPGRLYQYDLTATNINASRVLIHETSVNTRGALQLAIDGKIYRALSISRTSQVGTAFLGIINDPEVAGLGCNYVHDALDISNGDSFRRVVEGLPPFIQSFFLTSISANNVCFGDTTEFFVNSTVTPTSISWDFGDPASGVNNTSNILNPTHVYTSSGTFTVTATITIGTETTVVTLDVTIYDEPIVTTPVTLRQCDDDTDGFVDFNLEQANTLISSESPLPNFTYFLSETDAIANINPITNHTTFSNATAAIVWARVENASNCFSTAQINLQVVNSNIPSSLLIQFYECDTDVDGDATNGLATFDFSSATAQVLTSLLPETNLAVAYYETIADALAEINAINPSNYANTTPFNQQIVVRVNNLSTGCYGLGYHVELNVNPIPSFDLLATIAFCENEPNKTIQTTNPGDTYSYVWEDSSGNTVGNAETLTITTADTYTVTATDTNGNNCSTSKSIQVTFNPIPVVNSPVNLVQCDDDIDGIVNFNLNEANSIISSEIPAPTITYFLSETDALSNSNQIPNPIAFSNSVSTTVWARIENGNACVATSEVNLVVASTDIPDSLLITFNECDTDVDGNENNGLTTFDFSSATNQVLTALLPETNLSVAYYETIDDALAEINAINPSNYTNTTAYNQQIVVRVDNNLNECFGLGYHVELQVNPVPLFTLQPEVTFCFISLNHTIGIENPQGNYNYQWTDQNNLNVGNTPEITISEAGIYTVTASENGNTCSISKSIIVNGSPLQTLQNFSEANLEITNNTTHNTITVLTTLLPSSEYEFAINNEPYQSEPVFTNVYGGKHTIYIRDILNCLEASIEISLISIPNFFTPNFDGINDTWHVSGIEFQPNSKVYIFDRFGKSIAVLNPLGPGWNGFYKGNPLPSTDYWYLVELEDGRVFKGHFSLIRR